MAVLIIGLILFLGVHSIRIFAESWRTQQIERLGKGKWMSRYALVSLLGFVLIVIGFGQAREEGVMIWTPPIWTWHITITLMLVAFIFITAAYVPHNAVKAKLKDPMILGVKTWALAHLISNGSLAGMVLFGSFLVWAVLNFSACKRRRATEQAPALTSSAKMTVVTLLVGVVTWALMAMVIHKYLIGIAPL